MSRNSSGNYTLPSKNPVVTDTVIESAWANSTMEDIGNEITGSLSRTGKGGMLAPLLLTDGTVSLPSMAFTSDQNSGFYRADSNDFRMAVGGQDNVRYQIGKCTFISNAVDGVAGPDIVAYRDSASPAAADDIGRLKFDGNDSADEQDTYAMVSATVVDPTTTSEDGTLDFWTMQAGTLTKVLTLNNSGNASFAGDVLVAGDLNVEGNTNIDGNLFVDGDTTFAGNATFEGDVDLGSNVTYQGEDLATYISENGGGGGGGDPDFGVAGHRYWRIKFNYGSGTCVVREIQLFEKGGGFLNGMRWAAGTQMPANSPSAVTFGPDNANNNGSDLFELFDGSTFNTVTFSRPGGIVANVDLELDFGVGNAPTLSSIRFNMQTTNPQASGFQILYSDDGSAWTVAGVFDPANWVQNIVDGVPSPHLGITYSPADTDSDYAVTDANVPTIPPTEGGGGGGSDWWQFSTVAADVAATSGFYYLCDTDFMIVTLPSSPEVGDRVGIRKMSRSGVITIDPNGEQVEKQSPFDFFEIYDPVSPEIYGQGHVSLVYEEFSGEEESVFSWTVFNGNLRIYAGS